MAGGTRAVEESPQMKWCTYSSLRVARLGAALVLFTFCIAANSEVRLPNGEYTTTVEDLKVKVLGGYVTIARSWTNGRWYINPDWASLKFTFDSLDGSVKGIERAGTIYERASAGLYLYKVDQPFYIQQTAEGLRWYDTKGNWITYNANGNITAYGDRDNVQVSFTLDANGHPTQVLDNFGQPVLSLQYVANQLTGITDRTGRQVQYQYTGSNLTQVIDVLGNASIYGYDANGQLTSLTDQEAHTTAIVYAQSTKAGGVGISGVRTADSASATSVGSTGPTPREYKIARVFTVTDPEGNATTYLYDYDRIAQFFTVTQKFPGGRTVIGIYDALGRLRQQTVGTRTVMTMTRDGDRTEMIADERGLVTTTVFDGAWNPIKVTYPDGTSVSATYDSVYSNVLTRTDEAGTQTSYQYDAKGNLIQMTEAVGLPEQRGTTYTYDQFGQRLTMTRKGTTSSEDATTTYSNDSYGNIATVTDAIANLSVYTFDVMGNVLSRKDPRGNTWTRTYNNKGWLTSQIDPLAHGITGTYDKVGNRTKVTDALNNSTTLAYNKNDWLISVTDPLNGVSQIQYDAEGRKIKDIDPNNVTMSYGYDGDGRLSTRTDGNGNVTTTVYGDNSNALNGLVAAVIYPTFTELHKYDARNRLTQTIQVLDQSTSYVTSTGYDGRGNIANRTDALNRATQLAFDALNRQIRITDAIGGLTQYAYDVRDNLTTVTDANGSATRYTYDKADRKTSEIRPLGEATLYGYDGNGNLTTRTNAKGEQRRFSYDSANRRTQEQQFALTGNVLNTTPSRTIVFGYDARNLLGSYDDATTNATYGYDAKGQKTQETLNFGPFSKTIQYGYQANGKKASFTYPDNTSIQYTYDGNNQLKTIVTPQGSIAYNTYRWTAPTQVSMPGVAKLMSYDALLRPAEIKAQAIGTGTITNPLGNVLLDYRYSYDAMSNILQRQTQDGAYGYGYDNLDRLTAATPPPAMQASVGNPNGLPLEAYTYDGVHNRLTSQHQPGSWQYNANSELLSYGQAAGAVVVQYDANGHTVQKTANGQPQHLSYDVAERLIRISDASDTTLASYYYDPFGRRLLKTVAGSSTYFQYADEGLIAEHDATGVPQRLYGWQPDGTWGTNPQFVRDNAAYRFYVNDHLGTPQLVEDTAGNAVWKASFEAFGKAVVDLSSVLSNALRFPGQYYDQETGTHYNYYRDYDPTVGRYTASDPIGLKGGINPYLYASADPVSITDPTGRQDPPKVPWFPPYPGPTPPSWFPNWYGNWCGPGGSSWTFDCVDAACKAHDQCYDKCGLEAANRWLPRNWFNDCALQCDKKGLADLYKCAHPPCS
jgi:RHS repeat-associated protein